MWIESRWPNCDARIYNILKSRAKRQEQLVAGYRAGAAEPSAIVWLIF